jgi:hypothetical protein
VRMVYLPPAAQPRPQPAAPPVRLPPPKSGGPTKTPEPDADPIRAIRSPVAAGGGPTSAMGRAVSQNSPADAPRPEPRAVGALAAEPPLSAACIGRPRRRARARLRLAPDPGRGRNPC